MPSRQPRPTRPKWPVFALIFAVLGAAGSVWSRSYFGPAPHYAVYLLIVVFSAWLGALFGAAVDWAVSRRSPLEPLFKGRFGRYYKLGLWLRFAIVFAGGWILSALLALIYTAIWGDADELRAFVSPDGLAAVGALAVVYALLGALMGGLISAAAYLFGDRGPSGGVDK